eukprot:1136314-Pelagomonas_calceolata.AAC.1
MAALEVCTQPTGLAKTEQGDLRVEREVEDDDDDVHMRCCSIKRWHPMVKRHVCHTNTQQLLPSTF